MKCDFLCLSVGTIGLVSLLTLQSCQRLSARNPSSSGVNAVDTQKIESQYALNMELEILRNEIKKININTNGQSVRDTLNTENTQLINLQAKRAELEAKKSEIEQKIQSEVEDLKIDKPQSQWGEFTNKWRQQEEKIYITDLKNYSLKNGSINREFTMDLSGTNDYKLGIVNKIWNQQNNSLNNVEENKNNQRFFEASIKCNDGFRMKSYLFSKSIEKNKIANFRIYEQSGNSANIYFNFSDKITNCEMLFSDPENSNTQYGIRLKSNIDQALKITKLNDRFQECILPNASGLKGVEKLFLTPNYNSMTCAQEVDDIKTLEVPTDGLKAKAESLLGRELSDDFVNQMNPYAELDFSNAPKLNTILISYLVFRHDFYGTLIARLAKWHAEHGAQVRILMSDVIAAKKDKILLHDLVENSNNIKIQEFRYDSDMGSLGDHLSEFHRTMHVKLLVTLSDNPSDNVVYIGGRNIHDGFVFMKTPDHSAYPELIQYGSQKGADEGYAPWRDFEMRIKSKKFAEEVASHYMTLWQRDSQTFYARSINQNIVSKTPLDPKYFERDENSALIRHFMSIPYKDDSALENFYIDIFESAEKSIRLSTPYFRPTKKIGEAIKRAVDRGVKVTLITRIDLSGDTAAIILGEVNKEGINSFLNKIKIYEYLEPGVILHSKIILIDDKISILGSVNLNKRSFIHDLENGVMIYNPAYNQKMNSIMDTYSKIAREVTEKQKIAFWKKIVIGIFDKEF